MVGKTLEREAGETNAVALARVRALAANGSAEVIRKAAYLTRGDFAREVGVDPGTVRRWELKISPPSGEAAIRYLRLLDELRG